MTHQLPAVGADRLRNWIVAGMLTWAAILALAWLVMWTVREMSR